MPDKNTKFLMVSKNQINIVVILASFFFITSKILTRIFLNQILLFSTGAHTNHNRVLGFNLFLSLILLNTGKHFPKTDVKVLITCHLQFPPSPKIHPGENSVSSGPVV